MSKNGLLSNAKRAKSIYQNAQDEENEILAEYEEMLKTGSSNNHEGTGGEIPNNIIGEEFDITNWHKCDGTLLAVKNYPELASARKDLVKFGTKNETPEFFGPNSRVKSSGSPDANWPAYLAFCPTLVSQAGSGWLSQGGSGPKWISVDMEKNTEINKIEITNVNHQNMDNAVGAPIDFSLKGSFDDIEYEDIINITGNEHINKGEVHSYSFKTVAYRYYKIEITKGTSWHDGNSFYGFRFLKFFNEGNFINLPDEPNKIIKVK